ncbi:MAG TPA: thiamine pyrophosphate-binding protein [Acidimicrobiales bacterium]
MKVYDALAQAFVEEGTEAVFGLLGDANMFWVDALHKLGVPTHEVRHEAAATSMAEAWARVRGTPGVCTTTSGPGTAQITTPLVIAARDRVPLVAFCADSPAGEFSHNQRFDQARFAAAAECGYVRVASADSAYEAVRRAFTMARLESRPVMLGAPIDVQRSEFDDLEEYFPSTSLMTNEATYPNPAALDRAVAAIEASERPVIIAGRGAVLSGAGEEILRLGDRIGALVATSLLTLNWLRDGCEYHAGVAGLYATKTAMELFQESDCVIAVGASLNHYTTEHGYLFPDATYVHIDTQPQVVMGTGRSAACYVQADARVGVAALLDRLPTSGPPRTGYRVAEVHERLARARVDTMAFDLQPGTLDPRAATLALDEMIPAEVDLILGNGHQFNFWAMLCARERPLTLVPKGFSAIGQGLSSAIGAMVATGGRPTFLVEGDAGFLMYLAEFETAVRLGLPLLVVVFNDQALGAELHSMSEQDLDPELSKISTPDLGAVGVALGGRGRLVRDVEGLREGVAEYLAAPGPMIIDARVSQSVVSIPTLRLRGHEV